MRHLFAPFARLAVVIALTFAMAGSGLAHRFSAPEADEGLLAYVQAGGALADLCGEGGLASHLGGQSCDACRLVDCAMVPPAGLVFATSIGQFVLSANVPAAQVQASVVIDPSRPVRAPPAFLI
jgi:hypothetical protein